MTGARRRAEELGLGLTAFLVVGGGYVLLALSKAPRLPADLWGFLAIVLGFFAVAHFAVRRFAPQADPTLLPIAMLLNGLGFVAISRLDLAVRPGQRVAGLQAVWTAVGVGAFVVTLIVVRRVRSLERYRYTFLLLGMAALVLPLAPGIGRTVNDARLWVRLGPLQVQPGEAAKVLLVLFFAAYLVDRRELLASGSRRVGRLMLPDPRHLGPLLVPWAISIMLMVQQKDLGSSLLFLTVFVAMLYMATSRGGYLIAGAILFAGAVFAAYHMFAHVAVRVDTWVNPWPVAQNKGYQLVQSLFAFGTGGFAGTGLGLGRPDLIPKASTDFVFAVFGEELGLLGTVAVVAGFILLVGSAYRIAVRTPRPFSKLFAAGLATVLGIQTFVIVGGVTRTIPLTGITLPFVSYGGSSLVANYIIIALLLRISDETAADAQAAIERRSRFRPVEAAA